MKVVSLLGSKKQGGQTDRAVEAFLQGARNNGFECVKIFLTHKKIERCRQCDENGWGICRTEGRCVIQDDFGSIVDEIASADIVVFATPVYFGDLSESMKAFTDRLRRTCMHQNGKEKVAGKRAIGICVAGGGGGGAPTCCVSLERVLSTCGFDLFDIVPARRQNLEMKVQILELMGGWLTKTNQ